MGSARAQSPIRKTQWRLRGFLDHRIREPHAIAGIGCLSDQFVDGSRYRKQSRVDRKISQPDITPGLLFNSIPYSRYHLKALYILHDYAPDEQVKIVARGLLDWIFAKQAVSG